MDETLTQHNLDEPVRCGQCGETFENRAQYLDHGCPALNGATPRDPEAMGEGFEAIQQAAIERGAANPDVAEPTE